jgi:glycosyltransferase involved in cell wall biosynthesis
MMKRNRMRLTPHAWQPESVHASLSPQTRILIIAHNHPLFFAGGGEILAYGLFQQFINMGFDARFVAATGSIQHVRSHSASGLEPMTGSPGEWLYHNDHFDYFMQSHRDLRQLQADWEPFLHHFSPDIVHLHHSLRYGVELAELIRRVLPQARIIYTLHDYIPICHRDGQMLRVQDQQPCELPSPNACQNCFPSISAHQFVLRERFIQTHFDRVDAFIAPSRGLEQRYTQWGLPGTKLHMIRNGIAHQSPVSHRSLRRGKRRNHFVYMGQISHYKGTLLLIDAARELIRRGCHDFQIAIHGHYDKQPDSFKQEWAQQTANLPPQIRIYGSYRQQDIPRVLADADWLVMPSIWWENSPLVIAESLQHRRPVICSDIGGMAEAVQHESNGLHFRAGSAAHLADSMERAMRDTRLWARLVRQIDAPYSITAMANDHVALYRSLQHEEIRQRA